MKEPVRKMPPAFEEVAGKASKDFAASIPVMRKLNDLLFLIVQRGTRDEEQQFRETLKRDVQSTVPYRVKTWQETKDKLKGVGSLLEKAGLVGDEEPDSLEGARTAIRIFSAANVKIQGVLLLRVTDFEMGDHGLGSKVTIEGELHDLVKGTQTPIQPVTEAITSY